MTRRGPRGRAAIGASTWKARYTIEQASDNTRVRNGWRIGAIGFTALTADSIVADGAGAFAQDFGVCKDLTPVVTQRVIVGDTSRESLTLITCAGPFNHDTSEYFVRMVVRAVRV